MRIYQCTTPQYGKVIYHVLDYGPIFQLRKSEEIKSIFEIDFFFGFLLCFTMAIVGYARASGHKQICDFLQNKSMNNKKTK